MGGNLSLSPQMKTEAARPPFLSFAISCPLSQPSRGMGEQRVYQARLRGEVGTQRLRATLVAGDFVEQALELGDVAVDRLLEAAVGAVLARDFVERLLAGRR